ncbi:FAD-binding oxidoreductase [Halopseudomonas salina]|uniref:FAD-linked oxidase n=1 Tax=Halopseudomonas salina TaxID=1323744 RepID=A0ABQ1PVR1_9GAMM|nr:FAD-binding oxidoreductase [Halopseudomonas salina]GGD04846.1 FAD-linked oxidase [Halopseudomonas salina]
MDTALSWGRYPHFPQTLHPLVWRNQVADQIASIARAHGELLPFGNGRSYGDSCLATSGHVLQMRSLDRFIAADWVNGILRAEAGVTLGEILQLSIPRGWFLPVTPGTQFATLGGALANDVHGKNHHIRGTFGSHVNQFSLVRSVDGALICSREIHAELFAASIGGLGLTGVIEWAEIQLMPISSSQISGVVRRFDNLDRFFELSEQLDDQHEYSVAWIDCLATGSSAGRGVYFVGDHAPSGTLDHSSPPRFNVPFAPSVSLVNNPSLRIFNELYWRKHQSAPTPQRSDYQPFFYPLDGVSNWNRIYGRSGFQQYQCIVPHHSAREAIRDLLDVISSSGQGSFLAVLKRCGNGISPGLLSFPQPGISLALDFPQVSKLASLFNRMDLVVREAGGRLYPAKDAHMSGADFRSGYPAWEQVELLRDPSLNSRFWKRVTE